MLKCKPCELSVQFNVDYEYEQFQPPPTLLDNRQSFLYYYHYYGINEKFTFISESNETFLNSYEYFLYENGRNKTSSVVASLYFAKFHAIIVDVDMKHIDENDHKQFENNLIAEMWNILRDTNPVFYCSAKRKGKALGHGLHVYVPNVFLTRLDYLVFINVLKQRLDSKCPPNCKIDAAIRNWSLPFASKSGAYDDVYFPYCVYYESTSEPTCVFGKTEYVDTFLNIILSDSCLKNVWCFESLIVVDNNNHEDFVPILKGLWVSKSVGRRLKLIKYEENNCDDDIVTFRNQFRHVTCPDFKNLPWGRFPLVPPSIDNIKTVKEFEELIYPITTEMIMNYSSRQEENVYKIFHALNIYYDLDKAKAIFELLNIEEKVKDMNFDAQPYHPSAITALLVDMFNDPSDKAVKDAKFIRVKTHNGYISLNGITDKHCLKKTHLLNVSQYITPIVQTPDRLTYYMDNNWREMRPNQTNQHLYNVKFKLLHRLACVYEKEEEERNDMVRKLLGKRSATKTNGSVKVGFPVPLAICHSKTFWQRFRPLKIPLHMFVFHDKKVMDFRMNKVIGVFPLYMSTQRSTIRYVDIATEIEKLSTMDSSNFFFTEHLENAGIVTNITQFLSSLCNGDKELADFLTNLICEMIQGLQVKRLLYFHGPSANNGKTTLLHLLNALLGGMSCYVSHRCLQKGLSETNNDLKLASKCKVMFVDEIASNIKLNTTILKLLTGLSTAYVRGLYDPGSQTDFNGTLLLAGNALPNMEITDALVDRLLVFPFKSRFLTKRKDHSNIAVSPAKHFTPGDYHLLATELYILCHVRFLSRGPPDCDNNVPEEVQTLKDNLLSCFDNIDHLLNTFGFKRSTFIDDKVSSSVVMNAISKYNTDNPKSFINPTEFIQRLKHTCFKIDGNFLYGITANGYTNNIFMD